MAGLYRVVEHLVLVALCCLVSSSRANPITLSPTTDLATVIATQSTRDSYALIITDLEILQGQFTPMLNSFKTDRLDQSDVRAPTMDIFGFLTVTEDLPTSHQRLFMTEEELLPMHKQFLLNYIDVMEALEIEEDLAERTHPNSYTKFFKSSYQDTIMYIQRVEHKVSELMTLQGIPDGEPLRENETFVNFQAVPHNPQVHNTRSLYVLQSIDEYILNSFNDFSRLLHLS